MYILRNISLIVRLICLTERYGTSMIFILTWKFHTCNIGSYLTKLRVNESPNASNATPGLYSFGVQQKKCIIYQTFCLKTIIVFICLQMKTIFSLTSVDAFFKYDTSVNQPLRFVRLFSPKKNIACQSYISNT